MVDELDLDSLKRTVSAYRVAMQAIAPDFDLLESFPRGCCGLASTVLSNCLLSEHGLHTTYYWIGMARGGTHAWLMYDDEIVIDPTVDQFSSFDEYNSENRIAGTNQMDATERRIYNRVLPMLAAETEIDERLVFKI